jgi:hypothetical protein
MPNLAADLALLPTAHKQTLCSYPQAQNKTMYYDAQKHSANSDLLPTVPDHASRIRDVILVRRIFISRKPQGVGNLEWGEDGKGEISS